MTDSVDPITFGDCELNMAARELRIAGQAQPIEPKAFDLLEYLVRHRDRAVSKDELQDALWPDVIVTEASLTRTVMKARKAVGDDAHRQAVIKTLPRRGYRFIADVSDTNQRPRFELEGLSNVKFVKSHDAHIAYRTLGDGPIDLLYAPGFVSHLDIRYRIGVVARFDQRLAENCRVIAFDKRGVGLSERIGYSPTIEHTVDDMLAVLDAVGSKRAVLFGVSECGPASALLAATHPQRVQGLIMYGAFAKGVRSDDYPWALTRDGYNQWLADLVDDWGGAPSLDDFAPSVASRQDFRDGWARYLRAAATPASIADILGVLRDIDVRDVLPAIRTPTLILHRRGDRIVRCEAGRDIAQRIAGARFAELEGDDHWWFVGDTEAIHGEIEAFLAALPDEASAEPSSSVLATVLAVQFGSDDAAFNESLNQTIALHRGGIVESASDSVLARFDGPTRALQCAMALNERCSASDIELHGGLHAGEIEERGAEIVGAPVELARSLMTESRAGEVIATSILRDLAAGSGISFAAREIAGDGPPCFSLIFER